MIFLFPLVYVMYYIYSLVTIVPSLHPWDESHLINVYDLVNWRMWFANVMLRILVSMFISDIALKFSFFVVSLSGFGFRMMVAS